VSFPFFKDFVCWDSRWFRAYFGAPNVNSIRIKEVAPAVLGIYQRWLYTKHISTGNSKKHLPSFIDLADLWLFADGIMAHRLQNRTINLLEKRLVSKTAPTIECLMMIYEGTSHGSLLRKFIADTWDGSIIEDNERGLYPKDLLIDLLNSPCHGTTLKIEQFDIEKYYVDETPCKRKEKQAQPTVVKPKPADEVKQELPEEHLVLQPLSTANLNIFNKRKSPENMHDDPSMPAQKRHQTDPEVAL
jgi:hypothetical protein